MTFTRALREAGYGQEDVERVCAVVKESGLLRDTYRMGFIAAVEQLTVELRQENEAGMTMTPQRTLLAIQRMATRAETVEPEVM